MTKEEEILERHLNKVLQKNYVKRNLTAWRACLNALNEAINYKSSCDALPCEICGSTEHKKFDNPSCNCVPN